MMIRHLKNKAFILVIGVLLSSTIVYAENRESKGSDTKNAPGMMKDFADINISVSKRIDKWAESLDKNISPDTDGVVEENETYAYFVVGGDFNDHGDVASNFRYGLQLRLPRFEKYWKLKFANQDEKRERGQGKMTREQRTRNTNDDIFLGIRFGKRWKGLDFDYQPKLAYHDGLGLDHSIGLESKFEIGIFSMSPGVEFFANHDEGTGFSGELKFLLWLYKKYFAIEQGNDARYLNLPNYLVENHYAGFRYVPTDRLNFSLHYFRAFRNEIEGYELSAYGYYLVTNYVIYRNMLAVEARPYVVFERDEDFERTNGIVLNFKVIF